MSVNITTKIKVEGLRLRGFHGVMEQEARVGNVFVYDVTLKVDWLDAAIIDDVERTINYAEVIAIIRKVNDKPVRLIETVAYGIYRALAEAYPSAIRAGSIKVTKPKPPVGGVELAGSAVTLDW